MTPEQCAGARRLLGWNQIRLAEESSVGVTTVRRFEARSPEHNVKPRTIADLRRTLEAAGIEFVGSMDTGPPHETEIHFSDGNGVRLTRARDE